MTVNNWILSFGGFCISVCLNPLKNISLFRSFMKYSCNFSYNSSGTKKPTVASLFLFFFAGAVDMFIVVLVLRLSLLTINFLSLAVFIFGRWCFTVLFFSAPSMPPFFRFLNFLWKKALHLCLIFTRPPSGSRMNKKFLFLFQDNACNFY